jgi:hypothetical protein
MVSRTYGRGRPLNAPAESGESPTADDFRVVYSAAEWPVPSEDIVGQPPRIVRSSSRSGLLQRGLKGSTHLRIGKRGRNVRIDTGWRLLGWFAIGLWTFVLRLAIRLRVLLLLLRKLVRKLRAYVPARVVDCAGGINNHTGHKVWSWAFAASATYIGLIFIITGLMLLSLNIRF